MRLFVILFTLIFLFSLTGCKNKSSDIDGQWQRFDTVWKFENGKAHINGTEYEFSTDGEKLFLKNKVRQVEIPYTQNGNMLEINGSKFIRKN
ncbi:MAG: hypothetical protein IKL21_05545 [Clostridia bacterium]|nr:hypothetical protein [Clostridia bacterium]